jgi:hypothetical protein
MQRKSGTGTRDWFATFKRGSKTVGTLGPYVTERAALADAKVTIRAKIEGAEDEDGEALQVKRILHAKTKREIGYRASDDSITVRVSAKGAASHPAKVNPRRRNSAGTFKVYYQNNRSPTLFEFPVHARTLEEAKKEARFYADDARESGLWRLWGPYKGEADRFIVGYYRDARGKVHTRTDPTIPAGAWMSANTPRRNGQVTRPNGAKNRWGTSFKKGDLVQDHRGYTYRYVKLAPVDDFARAYGRQALVSSGSGPIDPTDLDEVGLDDLRHVKTNPGHRRNSASGAVNGFYKDTRGKLGFIHISGDTASGYTHFGPLTAHGATALNNAFHAADPPSGDGHWRTKGSGGIGTRWQQVSSDALPTAWRQYFRRYGYI